MYKFALACLCVYGVGFAQQTQEPVTKEEEVVLKQFDPMGCGCGKGKGKGKGDGK